ncbi:hypothetical protein M422DRAFT_270400 [Sphaerobolus stellatus SS14]|uniref:Uncharacterized protein n=1 Tax=Sphaerobolus stellatus (strain SS14) TaxID=990650 RepID=A0A0C9USY1_SPHS4|nr:hypothetical protein M422DRAFT_270400 [Sphaerobolus stellatus SS14]
MTTTTVQIPEESVNNPGQQDTENTSSHDGSQRVARSVPITPHRPITCSRFKPDYPEPHLKTLVLEAFEVFEGDFIIIGPQLFPAAEERRKVIKDDSLRKRRDHALLLAKYGLGSRLPLEEWSTSRNAEVLRPGTEYTW